MIGGIRILVFGLLLAIFNSYAANIVTDIPGSSTGNPDAYQQFSKVVQQADGSNITLLYRIYRYGPSGSQNLPLLVQVHEWGGDFARMESITSYESQGINFAMLAFQFQNSDDNTWNWWYGSLNSAGNQTVPWVQNEIITIIRECMTTNKVQTAVNCTIDTNRIYIYGMSIGGTGAVQIGLRHPEIFAALCESAGWTRYWGHDNAFFSDSRGCLAFSYIIGGINQGSSGCDVDSSVLIRGNSDQPYLPLGSNYKAFQYTDLKWYFGNYRDPGFESPFVFMGNGDDDNPSAQGDNLQPSLETQKRGYSYTRFSGGHASAISILNLKYVQKFRRNQSFCVFTSRNYGLNNFSATGTFNDLEVRGWDPDSIIDQTNHYHVKLTGTGTSDVTLRRLQNLTHEPGTVYDVTINGTPASQVVADQYGLVTIPQVANSASIDILVNGAKTEQAHDLPDAHIRVSPNPFNPETKIVVSGQWSAGSEKIEMAIYNIHGELICQLPATGCQLSAGITWNASRQPSGIYLIRVIADGKPLLTKAITLLK